MRLKTTAKIIHINKARNKPNITAPQGAVNNKNQVPGKPSSVYVIIYLGSGLLQTSSGPPVSIAEQATHILDLAPSEVCRAFTVTSKAVVSYTALSPLPFGGLLSVALSVALLPPAVSRHCVLRSPDFPLYFKRLLPGPGKKSQKSSSASSATRISLSSSAVSSETASPPFVIVLMFSISSKM